MTDGITRGPADSGRSDRLDGSDQPDRPNRSDLHADCASCFGLCCVALAFTASRDFAVDKAIGEPCVNLRDDYGCGVHSRLREQGYPGCTVYDCFGAGQKVSQVTFLGKDWRAAPETAKQMFAMLPIMRQLHEILWYLTEARTLPAARELHADIDRAIEDTERMTRETADVLLDTDLAAHRQEINVLLLRASELARADFRTKKTEKTKKKDRRGADLMGARLRGADLRGADLRGAYLIGADLRDADLRTADLIGADFRDADLGGADLTGSIFLTQAQVNAAKGDAATRIPDQLTRPAHWRT